MGKSKLFTEEEKEFMVYNYTILKRGVNAIGKDLRTSGKVVQTHLKKMGVKLRDLNEAMQTVRANNVNDNYFKTQSHNMAYVLGLLAADGYVSKDTNHWCLDLQKIDEQLLEDIKREIGFSGQLQYYTNNSGHKFCRLRVCSKTMKDDLSHYNITPQKTYSLLPPTFLDKKYYISYIRGYFDGDGCIYARNGKNHFAICSARKEVIEWIRSVLLNEYGITSSLQICHGALTNGGDFYYLHIYRTSALTNLFQLLYIPNSLYLERKKQTFRDIESTRLYSLSDRGKRYAELIQNEE